VSSSLKRVPGVEIEGRTENEDLRLGHSWRLEGKERKGGGSEWVEVVVVGGEKSETVSEERRREGGGEPRRERSLNWAGIGPKDRF